MKKYRSAILALCLPLSTPAADKGPPTAEAANQSVSISATLYQGKDAVRGVLGSDLGGGFIVVKVDLTPKGPKPLVIDHDDFLLRSYNDGQKCQPFEPTQIAGRASLAVVPVGGGGVAAGQGGPRFGVPGVGLSPPWPGGPVGVGSSTSGPDSVQAKVDNTGSPKEDPLLKVLKEKILPAKHVTEPVSGLLYFSLDGKHKPKDIALQYKTPSGVLTVQFR